MKHFLIAAAFAAGLFFSSGTASAQTPAGSGPYGDAAAMKGKGTGPRDGTGMKRGQAGPRNGQGNGPRRGNRTGPQNGTGPGCN